MSYRNIEQMIRQEYDEPASKVVSDYASLRYSKTLTAACLGITKPALKRLCDRFELHSKFATRENLAPQCKPKGTGWPKGKKRKVES